MMRSASREALANLRREQAALISQDATAATLTATAGELYAVAALLVGQPRLRRTLGDPATDPDSRAQLVDGLLRGKVGDAARAVVAAAARQRWSSPWDLTDALETGGDDLLFAAAERDGALDEVEDQLFRFQRVLGSEGELATLLDERSVAGDRRVALLRGLLAGKVHPVTLALLEQAVRSDRTRAVELAIDDLLEAAAARQERSVARVVSAAPLSEQQQERLVAALGRMYGRTMSLRSALDPNLRGGLVIRVGDELIDGSVAARLTQARTALAS
jgi:F-type H+-transporting ATPase subunit delta